MAILINGMVRMPDSINISHSASILIHETPILAILPYFQKTPQKSSEGVRKWFIPKKTGNYLNFSGKIRKVDFWHFGVDFEQQTQNRVFFARNMPNPSVGQKVGQSSQNRPKTIFL